MDYFTHFASLWDACPTSSPTPQRRFTTEEKNEREKLLDGYFSLMKEKISFLTFDLLRAKQNLLIGEMRSFSRRVLDYSPAQMDIILSPEMTQCTFDFAARAHQFEPSFSVDDIFQACRNVWIMNGIQYLLGVPVALTPSVFAYSMLYPYSDNLLDDPTISASEKIAFSHRFAERLNGIRVAPANHTEYQIDILVGMIEQEWDRLEFPEVYDSLLGIHAAQTDSMKLLHNGISKHEILRICVEKGGTSVVADGYLVAGKLEKKQKHFLYDYGAWLQLLDDLQDTSEDRAAQLITCFSGAESKKELEKLTGKVFHLGFCIMNEVDWLHTCDTEAFKGLMKKSIDLFLVGAVWSNRKYFSRSFVNQIEDYAPLHFSYVRNRRVALSALQQMIFRNMGNLMPSISSEKIIA